MSVQSLLYNKEDLTDLKIPKKYNGINSITISYEGNTTISGTPSPENPATLTPFEPPAVPGAAKQIGPLWSLPNGTKDTYDGETGVLVRRVGKLVLDGTEDWVFNNGHHCFSSDSAIVGGTKFSLYNYTFTHFASAGSTVVENSARPAANGGSQLIINFNNSTDVSAFKSWLAAQYAVGTPVTVYYELAEPVVERLINTAPISSRATDILAPSWEGNTTVTGTPSPDSPATITGVPFAATATGPDGETRSVDLGFTGYSLPNGVADSYDGKTGDFVQRVWKLVLDGTENWEYNGYFFYINTNPKGKNYGSCSCTHFLTGNAESMVNNAVALNLVSQLIINYNGATVVDAFKSWLAAQAAAGTPVTVYYELAEPIAYNRKADITAFEGQTTVTGADAVEVIEGRVLRVADCLPFEIVRVNKNLLDNAYFINPINQREQTSYTVRGYGIDRWYSYDRIDITQTGIKLLDNNIWFLQRFDDNIEHYLSGKVVTASVLLNNGVLLTGSGIVPHKTSNTYTTLAYFGNLLIQIGNTQYEDRTIFRLLDLSGNGDYTIVAAKLELGTTQTLARKVGNRWVLNDPPPDYGLELLKCQRYFQIFATESLRPTDKDDFRPTMRATPNLGTIVIDGKTYYTASAEL